MFRRRRRRRALKLALEVLATAHDSSIMHGQEVATLRENVYQIMNEELRNSG